MNLKQGNKPQKILQQSTSRHECCQHQEHIPQTYVQENNAVNQNPAFPFHYQFLIEQMDCPVEENLIRNKLSKHLAVATLDFNLIKRVLTVSSTEDIVQLLRHEIKSLGFEPILLNVLPDNAMKISEISKKDHVGWIQKGLSRSIGTIVTALILAAFAELMDWLGASSWIIIPTALLAIFISGISTYKKGWIALKNFNLNINALMSIAVTGAIIIGHWSEAAMVMALFNLAEQIEAQSLARVRKSIDLLLNTVPQTASRLLKNGQWQDDVNVEQVEIGDRVRVRAGEKIPLDAKVLSGQGFVNQATITGESLAIEKQQGDSVLAGTLNESGYLELEVTSLMKESVLMKIVHLVESAQQVKAPTQRFIDQFSKWYTPIVFILACLVALLPPIFFNGDWFFWIYNALVILVIACPCALVISTPVTIVSGLTAAARQGILIKGGMFLERGRNIRHVALDKTGTLTTGRPTVIDWTYLSEGLVFSKQDVYSLASSLANLSDHPISRAVSAYQKSAQFQVLNFQTHNGLGIQGEINGETYYLGNLRFVEQLKLAEKNYPLNAIKIKALEQLLQPQSLQQSLQQPSLGGGSPEKQGNSLVLLMNRDTIMAYFTITDEIKPTSFSAIKSLRDLHVKVSILSGDNQTVVNHLSKQLGIDDAKGELLPEHKLAEVQRLKQNGVTAMVGDGINDAPALAIADIGITMGKAGTDIAIETADVTLMDDDLNKITSFIQLSKRTHNILIQNIIFALGIKAVFLLLTPFGLGSLWMAVFADVGASLLVVGNGLRVLNNTKSDLKN